LEKLLILNDIFRFISLASLKLNIIPEYQLTTNERKNMKLVKLQRPTLTTWPSFGRLADIHDEIDRLFDSPLTGFSPAMQSLGDWSPALDIHEDKESFTVKVELSGMKKDDVNVSFQDGCLVISGERKAETKGEESEVYLTERFFGRFQRTVALPAAVAADKVKAAYKDGVLTITLPKTEEAKPKQIDIAVN
jgi:HSP20 family protein